MAFIATNYVPLWFKILIQSKVHISLMILIFWMWKNVHMKVIHIRFCLFGKPNLFRHCQTELDILNIKRIIPLSERTLHYADCYTFIRKFNWESKERVVWTLKVLLDFCTSEKHKKFHKEKQQIFLFTEFTWHAIDISQMSFSSQINLKVRCYPKASTISQWKDLRRINTDYRDTWASCY